MDNVSFMNELDEVLKAVNKVNQRINEVESKLDGFNRRLDNVELKVNAELNLQKQENDAKIINLSNPEVTNLFAVAGHFVTYQ